MVCLRKVRSAQGRVLLALQLDCLQLLVIANCSRLYLIDTEVLKILLSTTKSFYNLCQVKTAFLESKAKFQLSKSLHECLFCFVAFKVSQLNFDSLGLRIGRTTEI